METGAAYVWVGIGSALGGMGRYWLSGTVAQRYGEAFPWGTMLVNITGSFAIGLLAGMIEPGGRFNPKTNWLVAQFLMAGICGGYTTFSAFSQQTLKLLQGGQWLHAMANTLLSVLLCLIAVWLGYRTGVWTSR